MGYDFFLQTEESPPDGCLKRWRWLYFADKDAAASQVIWVDNKHRRAFVPPDGGCFTMEDQTEKLIKH